MQEYPKFRVEWARQVSGHLADGKGIVIPLEPVVMVDPLKDPTMVADRLMVMYVAVLPRTGTSSWLPDNRAPWRARGMTTADQCISLGLAEHPEGGWVNVQDVWKTMWLTDVRRMRTLIEGFIAADIRYPRVTA